MSIESYLNGRRAVAEFLTESGYPIGLSTLNKLAMPSRGRDDGPPPAGYWRHSALYDRKTVLAWAKDRFRTNWRGADL